ncbi:L-2-hydroxyglutarate oxidase LhgO [Saccharopolyspora kobensis]|uniref:L-2-hydroxyglutarate oxidase LhgO n=1 Tax=Saccharopolyspora kobensis TaxID=146035 RepID=A0A1H6ACI1_9PSEU|nr:L-2-hydroxyglutarate oxidase [Saccharopolyspora kobensis]SEG45757.1 L-2-hydroxyglutarate oxidase LhgO [Saccharopolyspora kobensis]SFE53434.1 L-2-hydroxyglutarate oxidase LhgO [Saccharopolyspora kobensis]
MVEKRRVAVVGGGIIGAAVVRELTQRLPGAEIVLFEKEREPAAHQTGHNSGVVHAGLYYEPGGLKARLCRRGVRLLQSYVAERDIPYERCGKVVVALEEEERGRLEAIHDRARRNGVPGVRLISGGELREIEPEARGIAAVHSPDTAIIDFAAVTRALVEDARSAGVDVRLGVEVTAIETAPGAGVRVRTSRGDERFDNAIACAGLQSDRLARRSGAAKSPSIVPFFGQYLVLEPRFRDITRGLVYPVPDPKYPFLGVHLTKRVDGAMTVGPNAFLSFSREIYRGLGIDVRDALETAADPGFWRFAAGNLAGARRELLGVLSTKKFIKDAARYVPAIEDARYARLPRGIRAQALAANGSLVDDFVIQHVGPVTHLRNAPSPGATSSLAIAEHIVEHVLERHDLKAR